MQKKNNTFLFVNGTTRMIENRTIIHVMFLKRSRVVLQTNTAVFRTLLSTGYVTLRENEPGSSDE